MTTHAATMGLGLSSDSLLLVKKRVRGGDTLILWHVISRMMQGTMFTCWSV